MVRSSQALSESQFWVDAPRANLTFSLIWSGGHIPHWVMPRAYFWLCVQQDLRGCWDQTGVLHMQGQHPPHCAMALAGCHPGSCECSSGEHTGWILPTVFTRGVQEAGAQQERTKLSQKDREAGGGAESEVQEPPAPPPIPETPNGSRRASGKGGPAAHDWTPQPPSCSPMALSGNQS